LKDEVLLLGDLTWPEVEDAAKAGVRTVIIPLGSTEEHGLHLPLLTDTIIAYEVAVRAASKVKAFVCPPVPFGVCRTTAVFPGTLTISLETLQSLVEELCLSLRRHGFRNLVLVPGHLGAAQIVGLELAAQKLIRQHPDLGIALVRFPEVLKDKLAEGMLEDPLDLHAGEVETSLMMFLRPDLVKAERVKAEHPKFPKHVVASNPRKYMETGVMGDASRASKAKGEAILKALVEGVVEAVNMLEAGKA